MSSSLWPWDPPGSSGVGCHALLQRMSPTRGPNLCVSQLLHWQTGSSPLASLGEPPVFIHTNKLTFITIITVTIWLTSLLYMSVNLGGSVLWILIQVSVQFSSVAQSCPILCNPMNCSTPGLPVHHQLLEPTQTPVHQVSDAIQPSHPLLSPSPSALNVSQHQGLFQWVSSLHQAATVLELQLQLQSFQWIFRTDFL